MSGTLSIHARQEELHRHLGHVLLRFQRLEAYLKEVVSLRFVLFGSEQAAAGFRARVDKVSTSPLGWLKEELFEKLVIAEGSELSELEINKVAAKGLEALQLHIRISSGLHSHLKDGLASVHARRNEIVHHFLEKFDLQTEQGCDRAGAYLQETHQMLDRYREDFAQLARILEATPKLFVGSLTRGHGVED